MVKNETDRSRFNDDPRRFVYKTQGVCPPEIHFTVRDETLSGLRFVGGGCPGNAQMVARLLDGRPLDEVNALSDGIDCRNGTSCPDQLAKAIESVKSGALKPARSFRVANDTQPLKNVALIGDLAGDVDVFAKLMDHIQANSSRIEAVYTVGNLTDCGVENTRLIKSLKTNAIKALMGEIDWRHANQEEKPLSDMTVTARDWLVQLPQVRTFETRAGRAMIFYGDYLQSLEGFSDYEPYALEMNMVCGLTRFMQDDHVFPALAAMLPQFEADIVIFGQTGKWGHWRIENTHFISVGAAYDGGLISWAHLSTEAGRITFNLMNAGR